MTKILRIINRTPAMITNTNKVFIDVLRPSNEPKIMVSDAVFRVDRMHGQDHVTFYRQGFVLVGGSSGYPRSAIGHNQDHSALPEARI